MDTNALANALTVISQILASQKAALVAVEAVHSPSSAATYALWIPAVIALLTLIKVIFVGLVLAKVKVTAEKAEALGNSTLGASLRATAAATSTAAIASSTPENIKKADDAQKDVDDHYKAQAKADNIQAVADGVKVANGNKH